MKLYGVYSPNGKLRVVAFTIAEAWRKAGMSGSYQKRLTYNESLRWRVVEGKFVANKQKRKKK